MPLPKQMFVTGSSGPSISAMHKAAYAVGTVIFFASMAFLAIYAYQNWSAIGAVHLLHPAFLLLSVAAYGISHLSTGLSWPLTVRALGSNISLRAGLKIGLIAQIGKYFPGNVAHYFGRAAIASGAGVTIKTTGISTAIEVIAAIVAAIAVASAAMVVDPATLDYVALQLVDTSRSASIAASVVLAAAVAIAYYMYRNAVGVQVILWPTLCLCLSFLLSGLSFAALLAALGIGQLSVAAIVAVFAVAWLAGFLVPGAPAGLGVREAILMGFIAPQIGVGPAIACALLHRVLTALVDLLAACMGYAAWMRSKKKKSANDVLSGSPTSQG